MKVIRLVLLVVHFFVVVLLFSVVLNAYVPPSVTSKLDFLSLAFPFFLGIHFFLTVIWLMMWKKRAFVFLFLTFFLYKPISRWVNWNQQHPGNIKIVTFNVRGGIIDEQGVKDFLKKENADIICIQESAGKKFAEGNTADFGLVTIISKFEIVNKGFIGDAGNVEGQSMYVDLKINNRIVRVINLHLESFHLDKDMVRPVENPERNKEKLFSLLYQLSPVFKIHEKQLKQVSTLIDKSPYPVIVTGDFNSVPNSWEYYQIEKKLQDAFVVAGKGSATSFHDYKFPIRIDYIFTSKQIQAQNYHVDRKKKLSDHFPVVAEFNWK